jgi:hypothetical protein
MLAHCHSQRNGAQISRACCRGLAQHSRGIFASALFEFYRSSGVNPFEYMLFSSFAVIALLAPLSLL